MTGVWNKDTQIVGYGIAATKERRCNLWWNDLMALQFGHRSTSVIPYKKSSLLCTYLHWRISQRQVIHHSEWSKWWLRNISPTWAKTILSLSIPFSTVAINQPELVLNRRPNANPQSHSDHLFHYVRYPTSPNPSSSVHSVANPFSNSSLILHLFSNHSVIPVLSPGRSWIEKRSTCMWNLQGGETTGRQKTCQIVGACWKRIEGRPVDDLEGEV